MLAGCSAKPHLSWSEAMQVKIAKYGPASEQSFKPYFKQAGVSYPPKNLVLLILKHRKQLQIYASHQQHWRFIRTFPVLAASGGPGPKLHSRDGQVPEGVYNIIAFNPQSHFDLSMQISYPNLFDRHQARNAGRVNLGGDIFVHGNRLSVGCVAIGDDAIQKLFPLVYKVGLKHVKVIIAPNDLRTAPPLKGSEYRQWFPALYKQIKQAMSSLPLPPQ